MRTKSTLTLIVLLTAVSAGSGCAVFAVEHGNVAFDVSPDGTRIVFSAADGDLYQLQLENQHVDRLTDTKETESSPSFSSDGRSVVLSMSSTKNNQMKLAELDLGTKRLRVLTELKDCSDDDPAFSPDGQRVTFVRAQRLRPYSMGGYIWDNYDIYIMNADGSAQRPLTAKAYAQARSPHFTADGRSIIFTGNTNNYPASSAPILLEVIADGTTPAQVAGPAPPPDGPGNGGKRRFGAWASQAGIAPDGKTIAFISDRAMSFRYDVFVMNRDGSGTRPLGITEISRYNKSPAFRPDGKAILFLAGTESGSGNRPIFSLWQVDVDGKNPRRIADSGLFTDPLHWQPKP
jgi:Tol biopolymer transport system component